MVAGRFGGGLQTNRKAKPEAETEAFDMTEYRRNFDAHLADIEAVRKLKLA